MERLQKVIAKAGVASRRKAEELISEGRVKVNDVVVNEMGIKVSKKDVVKVDNKIIEFEEMQYYVINKPRYIISSVNDDKGRKTVISILPVELKKERLFPVGRLDYDTKGVLLITNDGEFMNKVIGPKSLLEKEYLARVNRIVTKSDIKILENGVRIDDYTTRKCRAYIESIDRKNNSSLVGIILQEGKYHQVKRMFEAINCEVKKLTRIRFGCVGIGELAEGEIRELTPHEKKQLLVDAITEKNYGMIKGRKI